MEIYIAAPIMFILIVLAAPYLAQIWGEISSIEIQGATTVTGYIQSPVRPNTPVGWGEPNPQRGGSRDISTPIMGVVIGSILVVLSILYRYAYKRFHVEKNKREGVNGRVGEG